MKEEEKKRIKTRMSASSFFPLGFSLQKVASANHPPPSDSLILCILSSHTTNRLETPLSLHPQISSLLFLPAATRTQSVIPPKQRFHQTQNCTKPKYRSTKLGIETSQMLLQSFHILMRWFLGTEMYGKSKWKHFFRISHVWGHMTSSLLAKMVQ